MVSVKQSVPPSVLNGDVESFIDRADPSTTVKQRLRNATGPDRKRLLARAWFNNYHGSRNESKRLFVMLMKEEDIPFSGEDIEAITDDPPVNTQT